MLKCGMFSGPHPSARIRPETLGIGRGLDILILCNAAEDAHQNIQTMKPSLGHEFGKERLKP